MIRDYTVHVYVYGTSLAPEAIFTSEPPLPQEEIISLLATGTTREELTGNNNVLAGRAAMLLVQQLYRKVFKKGQATQSNSVFNRLDLDVGIDGRSAHWTTTSDRALQDQRSICVARRSRRRRRLSRYGKIPHPISLMRPAFLFLCSAFVVANLAGQSAIDVPKPEEKAKEEHEVAKQQEKRAQHTTNIEFSGEKSFGEKELRSQLKEQIATSIELSD